MTLASVEPPLYMRELTTNFCHEDAAALERVAPFIVLQLVGLVLIFVWEALVTWLPAQAY